eukprot:TRINITY_DN1583_c0_g3_i1.p1 TRINITY_DN1583_c0_g3~~TRINITY_DN1583_c0_g3_i1.p1  ORF type:complete len:4602 (-),score=1271.77 TRINITY_DN1583_c0_g3_i1:125-13930(-)
MESDLRLMWIQEKLCSSLSVPPESFSSFLKDSKTRNRQDLVDFLGATLSHSTVFFGADVVDYVPLERTIEKTIEVWETEEEEEEEEEEEKQKEEAEEGVQEGKTIKEQPKPEADSSGQESSGTEEPQPPKEKKRVKKEKVVEEKEIIKLPRVRFFIDSLPDDTSIKAFMFLLRNNREPVPVCDTLEEQEDLMKNTFDVGLVTNPLITLNFMLEDIFVPLFSSEKKYIEYDALCLPDLAAGRVEGSMDSIRTDFLGNVAKFSQQLSHAVQQTSGDICLRVPDVSYEALEDLGDDSELLGELDGAVDEWTRVIQQMIEQENERVPSGNGPMPEIEYWRERYASFSTLYEQIGMEKVQRIVSALERENGETSMLPGFKDQYTELSKNYMEAKDNVKFLTTLERHFKNISQGTLGTVIETLPSMMNALRMVWIISRHFNTDERMVPLMVRIAWQICLRVSSSIDLASLFTEETSAALQRLTNGQRVLDGWKEIYLQTRKKIENESSGGHGRWEFDQKRLFEKTSYMSERCTDLIKMVQEIRHFRNILSSELKTVTGEAQAIDDVIVEVDKLVRRVENVSFDPFDRSCHEQWHELYSDFHENGEIVEQQILQFIDKSFKKLRSAEGAFELLQNFKSIETRESISKKMTDKYSDILDRFSEEIDIVESLFDSHKEAPPVGKNLPPLAGTIHWSRSLFFKIKKTMLKLQQAQYMMQQEHGKLITKKYIRVGEKMRDFEKMLFADWVVLVDQTAAQCLKKFVLACEDGTLVSGDRIKDWKWKKLMVNFDEQLVSIIKEAKYLDRIGGLDIPDMALNIALQEEKYLKYIEDLREVVNRYHEAQGLLKSAERDLMDTHVVALAKVIRRGLTTLNWNSLGIQDFIDDANRHISEFHARVKQVQKNSSAIRAAVALMASTMLIKLPSAMRGELLDLQEFYETMESHRAEKIDLLMRKYRTIGPLLRKIEEIAFNTNTGKAPQMAHFYAYWETKIFHALRRMVMMSLSTFHSMLFPKKKKVVQPLFRITAALSVPDIVLSPQLSEIRNQLVRIKANVVESTQSFSRWMKGTCIEATIGVLHPPPKKDSGEIKNPFTFFEAIGQTPQIRKLDDALEVGITKTANSVSRYLDRWAKLKYLWRTDKNLALDKMMSKGQKPTDADFDEKMGQYHRLARDIHDDKVEENIGFVQVSSVPLIEAVERECREWIVALGKLFNETMRDDIGQLDKKMSVREEELRNQPETLDELKFVLNSISEIRATSMDTEMEYRRFEYAFDTLDGYGIPLHQDEVNIVRGFCVRWQAILNEADRKSKELEPVKERFTEVTKTQVADFQNRVEQISEEFSERGPGGGSVDLDVGLESMVRHTEKLRELQKEKEQLALAENLFGLPITEYPALAAFDREMTRLSQIYDLYDEWKQQLEAWSGTLWVHIAIEKLAQGTDEITKSIKKLPKELRPLPPCKAFETNVGSFKDSLPLFADLKSEALRDRHWKRLMEVTSVSFEMDPTTFTFKNMIDMELYKYDEMISEITSHAQKELVIEKQLVEIRATWRDTKFDLGKYNRGKEDRGYVLRSVDDILEVLEDNTMNLSSMSASRHVQPFVDEVRKWEKSLSLIGEVIEIWMVVQRKWMYLESIFVGSEDIRTQLPEEAKRFDFIDKAWLKMMSDTHKNTCVLDACHVDGRLEQLEHLGNQLDLCQKGLSDYLETKRNAFPRFFFISDDELLSILGSSDPQSVQEHMLKMFDNCAALHFAKNQPLVTGMSSAEGESFQFENPVRVDEAVEKWLLDVEVEMRKTLHNVLKTAVFRYPQSRRIDWIYEYLGMIALGGSQIWWTWEVEDSFRKVKGGDKTAVKTLSSKLTSQLNDLVAEVRKDLKANNRKKMNTMIIIDVHARDIVDRFVRDSILDAREFDWESQLRFYWDKSVDDCRIRQCTGEFEYGFEYMGLNGRLVITPLTDRCFMTLTQALTFRLGGSPAGPAGTGKTESVKDLAKAMALMCVVFNCGEGLDYKAMGRIFSGLVQSGAWGCFDEFNRIELPVLSVVSAQIRTIQNAMTLVLPTFMFEGREIKLDMKTGIFVTMNPGYAGRVELPDNLKALFRPCVMVVPDMEIICEIMLFSEGFESARVLARKMTVLYKLAQEQLSKQHHYDWGLRALKAVLVMAGALKRGAADLPEDVVLMRALRDMNAPKFVFEDVPLFKGLINDLFPKLTVERVRYPSLNDAVEKALEAQGYQLLDDQVDKVIQLAETMLTRHTTMIVGPTGGGKSVVLKSLAKAQTSLGMPTKLYVINPKAVSVSELYGVLDPHTRDWTDGLLSHIFREINKPSEKTGRRYIVYDGDVDAVWVENMNSVMDDNKLLTLPNGERIRLRYPDAAMLFEVGDLQYASPATVSRCGMVYVDPKNLGYKPFIWKWLESRQNKQQVGILKGLFDRYVSPCITFVMEGVDTDGRIGKRCKLAMNFTDLNMVTQLCSLLDILLPEENVVLEPKALEAVFIYCMMWSIGGVLVEEDRIRFDKFVKSHSGLLLMDNGENLDRHVGSGQLPERETLYEYIFNLEELRWVAWKSLVDAYTPPRNGKFASILVPTVDTVRTTWLLENIVRAGKPLMFIGDSGTAKTVTTHTYLHKLDREANQVLNVNFSSRTTGADVQATIEDHIEKRTKDTYGPPVGKRLLVFVDDLNMPTVDKYGTQQPIALLKLLIGNGGMYDRKDLMFKHVKDTQFLAALVPPGTGRNPVDPRFVSLFSVFNITFPSDHSLRHIFSSILDEFLKPFSESVRLVGCKLTQMTLELYWTIVKNLPPTPSKFHYIFNLRDLSRVFEGLCLTTTDKFENGTSLLRLWRNECLRVFHDRLIHDEDREVVTGKVASLVKEHFSDYQEFVMRDPVLFGDFATIAQSETVRLYEDLESYEKVKTIVDAQLEDYNLSHKVMNLVMFDDALEHLVRLHRVIRMDRGNALLVGVGGSGKQSLTRLATYLAGFEMFEITLSRGYGETEFREDLKKLYHALGAENKKMVFLFTDAHVVNEGFLEFINNILTSGMVPALYAEDEKDSLIHSVRDEVVKLGMVDTKDVCWDFFVDKCRDNLHVVLAMSPAGDTLRTRCRSFPGLVNNTVIDWFLPWPEQALRDVANVFVTEDDLPESVKEKAVQHMVEVHISVGVASKEFEARLRRANHVTPKNYLDFIQNYRSLLSTKRREIDDMRKRFEGGLTKLVQASEEVERMKVKLAEQQVVVAEQTEQNKKLMEQIYVNAAEAESKQQAATLREAELSEETKRIQVEKLDAEQQLEVALPALAEAEAALDQLNRDDIVEVRAFAQPPAKVQDVCGCVAILFDRDPSWASVKAMMADSGFLRKLKEYDKDSLNDKRVNPVKKRMKGTTAEALESISKAASGLAKWVIAIVNYHGVAKTVDPKRRAVERAMKDLERSKKDLEATKRQVRELSGLVEKLREDHAQGSAKAEELRKKAEIMERRLIAASRLIEGLSSEKSRWQDELQNLSDKRERLIGDALLCSSFLSYTGAFTYDFRHKLIYEDWWKGVKEKEIPVSDPFRLETLLTDEVEISLWTAQGLPSDELSIQNGILTMRASRYPLCIDPQQQAVNWIKKKEPESTMKIATFNDSDFVKKLENCVSYGYPFLFENVDEYIDPIIDPVLEKNIIRSGHRREIKLGDKTIEWDDSFRLYMCTKLANPHYSPEVAGKTMIINYGVTQSGLQDQLLNEVVGYEKSELEQQRVDLIQEMSINRKVLKDLEDSLLRELAMAQGNILDNDDLIRTLEDTKSKAAEIQEKLATAQETAQEIEDARQTYLPVAKRGAIIYFVMAGLSAINSMYEYSLASFMNDVFRTSLERSEPSTVVDTRLENIVDFVTMFAYNYTCTGIFENHKLMFSFQLTVQILDADDLIRRAELDFFLKGNLSLLKSEKKKPFDWIPEQGWEDLIRLSELADVFVNLPKDVARDERGWKDWYDLETPEASALPSGYDEKLDAFQRLCVLRCFRMDRVYIGVQLFVQKHMGDKYVQPPVLNYENVFKQSSPYSPIVCMISPGADPATDIFKLADKLGMGGNKMKYVALGQGQGPIARQMVETAVTRGQWVLLQNCHLLVVWLRELEKILEKMPKPHNDFRLWMTTEPTPEFPLGILQRSLKVVTEPPNGLKLNMRSTYSRITEEQLEECPHGAFRPLVYVLTFFHAVVQERRKYGKIGWNVPYDFNESDFRVSLLLLGTYLEKAFTYGDPVPWESLRYLVGEAMYGGRVTDSFDRRVLVTYLDEYMGDFLFDTFQPFHFFMTDKVDYCLPENAGTEKLPRDTYALEIEKMSLVNSPEVFGLHANAEIGYLTNAAKGLWLDLIEMQPRASGSSGGISREEYIGQVATSIQEKLPEDFDRQLIAKRIGVPSPTQVVLLQELERWNNLVAVLRDSLRDLKRALVGEFAMSAELDELAFALFNGQLPPMWRRLAPATEKNLASWLVHFQLRHEQYKDWVDNGDPAVMWLSGLHIPESYLTALVQTTCRRYLWPLDRSTLYTRVLTETDPSAIKEPLLDGCYVNGLYLEGAGWDRERACLLRQDPKVLVEPLPIMQIIPIEANKLKLQNTLRTPVYVTQDRRTAAGVGLVFEADLFTEEHPSHWVLQGVALVLNTS